jgi:hypothetical protein
MAGGTKKAVGSVCKRGAHHRICACNDGVRHVRRASENSVVTNIIAEERMKMRSVQEISADCCFTRTAYCPLHRRATSHTHHPRLPWRQTRRSRFVHTRRSHYERRLQLQCRENAKIARLFAVVKISSVRLRASTSGKMRKLRLPLPFMRKLRLGTNAAREMYFGLNLLWHQK